MIDLLARDRASDAIRRVGDESERTGKKAGGMGSLITGALGAAAGALVGGAVIGGLKGLYDAAAESAKIGKITESVIRSTGQAAGLTAEQVGDLATSLSNATGMDDELIQSAENLLLTFTNVKNGVGAGNDVFNQATALALDMSTVLGTDASGAAMQLGKALNDPVKGVTALAKAGVSFTAQQRDQIKALAASGDVLGAQKIILAEVGKEFGGAAAAAATPMDRLKVTLGNLQETLGTALIPKFEQAAGAISQVVGILFNGDFTGGPFSEDSGVVDGLFRIRDGAIQAGQYFRDTLWPAVQNVAASFRANLGPALAATAGFITGTVVPALASFFGFMSQHQTTVAVIAGLVGGLWVASLVLAAYQAAATAVANVVAWASVVFSSTAAAAATERSALQIVLRWVFMGAQAMLQAARMAAAWLIAMGPIGLVIAAVVGIVALIILNWDKVKSWTVAAWDAVVGAVRGAWDWISSTVSGAVAAVRSYIEFAWNWVSINTRRAWQSFKDAVSAGIDGAISFVTGLPGRILAGIGNLGSLLVSGGRNLIDGLVNGIRNAAGAVTDVIRNIASGALDTIKSFFGIASPSKVMHGVGENIGEGLVRGIAAMRPAVAEEMLRLADVQAVTSPFGIGGPVGGYTAPSYDLPGAGGGGGGGVTHTTIVSGVASPETVAAVVARQQRTTEFLAGVGA